MSENPILGFATYTVFKRGETFTRTFSLSDASQVASIPDSIKYNLTNPVGTVITANSTPSNLSKGNYKIVWLIPAVAPVGEWKLITTAIKDVYTQTETYTFMVE